MTTRAERPFAPRRLAHRGSVMASGFLIDDDLVGDRERCRRVLARWRPGAALRRLDGGRWWLRLPAPVRVLVDQAPGAPLVAEAGLACAAPGLAAEGRRLGAADGAAVLLRGGAVEVVAPTAGTPVDPSRWLDLGAFERLEVRGAAAAPAAPPAALRPVETDVRAVLGHRVPAATDEARRVAREIAARAAGEAAAERAAPRLPGATPPAAPGEPSPLVRWLAGMFRALSAALTGAMLRPGSFGSTAPGASRQTGGGEAGGATERRLVIRPVEPSGPGWLERAAMRLNDLAARMLMASRLAPVVGRKQAEYLDRMMRMFEQGDLDQALRHAIPLGGDGTESAGFSLGIPRPRSELGLSTGTGGVATSVLPYAGLHEELNRLYRAAFERLDAEGRVEEAAFVLAELLHRSEEAVAYLERHDRLALAAELAEGRKLPPALVVRQWFLAGETRRALLLARRHGAFADAVVRVEATHPPQARALRLLWAETLAGAGDFLGAERVAEPIEEALALRLAWLEMACDQGGAVGLTAIVRRLGLAPDSFAEAVRRLSPLLDDRSDEGADDRLVLAGAIQGSPAAASPELRALSRPLLRSLLRDTQAGPEPAALGRLHESCADGALRADWPRASAAADSPRPTALCVHEVTPGTVAARDAALLPGGRWLVALGEAGVMMLSRDGRRLHHFEQPADRLILSPRGDRAVALMPRGDLTRLARLDLAGRRSQPWAEAGLSCWAPDFDGSSWVVAGRDGVLIELDALADSWSSLWRLRDLGGRILGCGPFDRDSLGVLVEGPLRELWLWQFGLESRALRRRDEIAPERPAPRPGVRPPTIVLGPTGVLLHESLGKMTLLRPAQPPLPIATPVPLDPADTVVTPLPQGFLLATGPRAYLLAVHASQHRTAATATLDDATRIAAHASPAGLALSDDRGRLLALKWDAVTEAPRLMRSVRV